MTVEFSNGKTCRTCLKDGDILLKQIFKKLKRVIDSPNLLPKCSEELKLIINDFESFLNIFENFKRIINKDETIIELDDEDTSDLEVIGIVDNIVEVNRVEYRSSRFENNNGGEKYQNVNIIQPRHTAESLDANCHSKCDIEGISDVELFENDQLIAKISRLGENQHLHDSDSKEEESNPCPRECFIKLKRCDSIYKTLTQHRKRSQYSDEDRELLRLLDLSSLEKKSIKRSRKSSDGSTTREPRKRKKREKQSSEISDIDSYCSSSDSFSNSSDNESNCDTENCDEFAESYDSDGSKERARARLLQDSDATDSSDEEIDESENEIKCPNKKQKYKRSQKLKRKENYLECILKLPGDEFFRKNKSQDSDCKDGAKSGDGSSSEDCEEKGENSGPLANHESAVTPNNLESPSCNDDEKSDYSSSSEGSNEKDEHSNSSSDAESNVVLETKKSGRKNIRKVIDDEDITENTRKAVKDEEIRVERVAKRKEQLEYSLRLDESDEDENHLVLDFDADSKRALVAVDKGLVKLLKPHQKEGVKFMWDCCFESIEQIQSKEGSGCVLAHCMGLGKTLQVVTLAHTLLTNQQTSTRTVMIACPKNTILNWADEFRMWLKHSQAASNLSKRIFEFSQESRKSYHMKWVREWQRKGGVLIIGYEMFRSLTSEKRGTMEMRQLLLNPGADLVVCDEGHLLKNSETKLAKSMQCVKTKRRIILTGTPLQNNLGEYHCMIHVVKPNLLGSKAEFANRFENPINNGKLYDSTKDDVELMKFRAYVLHRLLKGCVQRRDYELLKSLLPAKQEYVISIRLSDLQMKMYDHYVSNVAKASGKKIKFFQDYQEIKLLVAHPKSLRLKTKEKRSGKSSTKQMNVCESDFWWRNFVQEENLNDISLSYKLVFLFGLLDSCAKHQEKVLVFSQCLVTLDVIERFLKKAKVSECNDNSMTALEWKAGHDYYRIDGKVSTKQRRILCNSFNNPDNKNVKLMLMSIKAGGLGINLTGANRVVMFAPSWNPSDDLQSIFRVFRFGQTKKCYVYRFVCAGTMEEKIYNRQVTKLALSARVLDEHQIERIYKDADLMELYKLGKLEDKRATIETPEDKLLAELLKTHGKYVFNIFEHESLLKNQEEEQLDEQQRQQAWHDYIQQKNESKTKATPIPEEQPSS